jgi:predicted RNA-binding Zn ribbon-like protein
MGKSSADVEDSPAQEYRFDFSGGRLCLDFVNTTGGTRARPKEHLHTYSDLLAWGRQAGVLSEREVQRLARAAKRRRDEAARTLAAAVELREAIFRILTGAAEGRPQRPHDMDLLNAGLARALAQVRLDTGPEGCVRVWGGGGEDMDRMLWPVVRSVMDVMTDEHERKRVHKCESPTCDWLFLDVSRNRSRRWCNMNSCGNRAKARRFYERHRHQAAPEQPQSEKA